MAIINDPYQLTTDLEITITPLTETITLNNGTGVLDDFGITGQAMYSFFKEEWKDDVTTPNNLMKYAFPMLAITNEQFEFGNNGSKFSNWRLASEANRKLMRKAGFREYDDAGQVGREYVCVNTLGTIDSTSKTVGDTAYYFFANDTAATDFTYAGAVDEVVQIFGNTAVDATSPLNGDKRSEVLTISIRTFGKTYGRSTTTEIDVSTLTYKVERFPVAEATDNVIQDLAVEEGVSVATLLSNIQGGVTAPYDDMTIGWFAAVQNKTGFLQLPGDADFGVVIDGDVSVVQEDGGGVATAEQIYAFVQAQLLATTDINDGAGSTATSYIGLLQNELLNLASTGNTLSTNQTVNPETGGSGVYVDSFADNDRNRVTFTDNAGAVFSFPFVATGSFTFNTNLQNDSTARYWLYYEYTRVNTVTDLELTGATGSVATVNTTGSDFTDVTQSGFGPGALSLGDYILLEGFTNPVNNGIWEITGAVGATSFSATKSDGATVVNEGPLSITVKRNPIASPDGTVVKDNGDVNLGDVLISGASSINFTYDYDGDTEGGRNPAVSPAVVLRVIGAPTAQFSEAEFSIARTTGQSLPISANLERNYNGAQ